MNDVIVIGVDHGYAAMKTVHFSFPTGLVEYEHEPYTQKDVLEYPGSQGHPHADPHPTGGTISAGIGIPG